MSLACKEGKEKHVTGSQCLNTPSPVSNIVGKLHNPYKTSAY